MSIKLMLILAIFGLVVIAFAIQMVMSAWKKSSVVKSITKEVIEKYQEKPNEEGASASSKGGDATAQKLMVLEAIDEVFKTNKLPKEMKPVAFDMLTSKTVMEKMNDKTTQKEVTTFIKGYIEKNKKALMKGGNAASEEFEEEEELADKKQKVLGRTEKYTDDDNAHLDEGDSDAEEDEEGDDEESETEEAVDETVVREAFTAKNVSDMNVLKKSLINTSKSIERVMKNVYGTKKTVGETFEEANEVPPSSTGALATSVPSAWSDMGTKMTTAATKSVKKAVRGIQKKIKGNDTPKKNTLLPPPLEKIEGFENVPTFASF